MKYVKMLGLLAVAAAALMAFVGTASAATLTSPAGTKLGVGTVIKATSTHTELTGTINITCAHSEVEGTISNAGGGEPTQNVSGNISKLTFTQCGNHTVQVLQAGSLSIQSVGGGKGTLSSTGAEVTVLTHSLFLGTQHCIYVTNNTHIGTVTGGTNATLTIASAPINQSPTGALCGDDAKWDGDYTVISPNPLIID